MPSPRTPDLPGIPKDALEDSLKNLSVERAKEESYLSESSGFSQHKLAEAEWQCYQMCISLWRGKYFSEGLGFTPEK